jgi:hypothetical protein
MIAATAESTPAARLPRSYLVWLSGAIVSQAGDAALYFALGWAASAHGGPAAGLVLSAVSLPRTVLLLLGGVAGDPLRRRSRSHPSLLTPARSRTAARLQGDRLRPDEEGHQRIQGPPIDHRQLPITGKAQHPARPVSLKRLGWLAPTPGKEP